MQIVEERREGWPLPLPVAPPPPVAAAGGELLFAVSAARPQQQWRQLCALPALTPVSPNCNHTATRDRTKAMSLPNG